MSDWFGMYGVAPGLNAGLDLEMPGLNKWRTIEHVNRTISARKITVATVKDRTRKVLDLVKKCVAGVPEVLDGDGRERTLDTDETTMLLRKLASESIVLLRNEGGRLPLNPKELMKIAVIGPNAKANVMSGGGGSASLKGAKEKSRAEPCMAVQPLPCNSTKCTVMHGCARLISEDLEYLVRVSRFPRHA